MWESHFTTTTTTLSTFTFSPKYLRRSFGLRLCYSSSFDPRYSLTYTPYQKVPSRLCFPRIRNYSTFNSFIRRSTYLPTSIIEAPMSFLQCDIQFFSNLRFVQQFPINAFTLTLPRARILDWISKLGGSMIQFSSGSDAFLLLSRWKVRFLSDIGFDMICLCPRHLIFLF